MCGCDERDEQNEQVASSATTPSTDRFHSGRVVRLTLQSFLVLAVSFGAVIVTTLRAMAQVTPPITTPGVTVPRVTVPRVTLPPVTVPPVKAPVTVAPVAPPPVTPPPPVPA